MPEAYSLDLRERVALGAAHHPVLHPAQARSFWPSARHAPGRGGRAGPLHDGPQPQSAGAPRLGSDRGWQRRPARARPYLPAAGEAAIEAALPHWREAQERIAALVQPSAIGELADRLDALGAREQIPAG